MRPCCSDEAAAGGVRGRAAGAVPGAHLLLLEHGRRARTRVPLEFASPEREADFILAIARERLGRLTLAAPTLALDLRAEALLPYVPRAGAWLPGAREQAVDRQRLVERLAARMGKERVFASRSPTIIGREGLGPPSRFKTRLPVGGDQSPQRPTGCCSDRTPRERRPASPAQGELPLSAGTSASSPAGDGEGVAATTTCPRRAARLLGVREHRTATPGT